MLKQKIVMQVDMHCDKCQKKCRTIAAEMDGFLSMAIEAEKSHLIITGVGIDSATLAKSLSKKVGSTSIISIEILKTEAQKKEEELKKKIKEKLEEEEKKKTLTWSYSSSCNNNFSYHPPPPPPPGYDVVCYGAPSYPNTWFTCKRLSCKLICSVTNVKCQRKCRLIAAEIDGFISVAIEAEKSHLIITGVGTNLAKSLSKKVGSTSLISIEIIKTEAQKKEDEIKKKIKEQREEEEKMKKKTLNWSYSSNCNNYFYHPHPPPPPGYDVVFYGAPSYPNTWFPW